MWPWTDTVGGRSDGTKNNKLPVMELSVKQGDRTMIWDNIEATYNTTMPHSATAEDLLALGLKYCFGRGVAQSYVEAHKWFNLAALKGNENAKSYRCELAREMSANDIAEAQRQARAWMTLH